VISTNKKKFKDTWKKATIKKNDIKMFMDAGEWRDRGRILPKNRTIFCPHEIKYLAAAT